MGSWLRHSRIVFVAANAEAISVSIRHTAAAVWQYQER